MPRAVVVSVLPCTEGNADCVVFFHCHGNKYDVSELSPVGKLHTLQLDVNCAICMLRD